MNRRNVCCYAFKTPGKKQPVLIHTRDSAVAVLHSVTVAPITPTIRGIPTEVVLTDAHGLPNTCAAAQRTSTISRPCPTSGAVSYTHLDVYKRQPKCGPTCVPFSGRTRWEIG